MANGNKVSQKINPIGSGKPDISAVDAAIISITEKIDLVKREQETQRSETRNIIIGVLVAFVAIVVAVAVQVILSDYNRKDFDDSRFNFEDKLNNQQVQLNDVQNSINNLKVANPYLK